MQIRISGPGAIFTSAKCRCSVREEALAPLQIFARLGSHTLAHACAQLSSESRVVFAWRSKRVTRNEPLFLVSKKRLESPLTLLDPSLCDLWKIHHVPRAFSLPPPFLPLPLLLPFLVLFYSPLFWILARRFCILLQVRRDRVSRLGRMVYAEFARYLRILFGENIVCPLFQINIVLH